MPPHPGGQGNIISWQWNFGDPLSGSSNNSTEQNPDHLSPWPGSYDVRLIVTNFNDCSDTIIKQVFVNELPAVDFTWDISCQDQPVEFSPDSSVMNTSTITSWLWDFGDGQSSTLEAPEHLYAVSGVYTVTLTVQDTGVCENFISHDVTIHPLPIANFTYDTPICQDGEAQFTDLSSTASGYITQWVWDYGDGTSDTINFPENPNPVHVYDTSGTFTVHLWVITTDSCEAEAEKTITVDAAPIADWEYEGSCADEQVQFTDLSTPVGAPISEWYWDFGDPVSGQNNYSAAQNPQHLFSVCRHLYRDSDRGQHQRL
ncbi:MAG: PKD domain-containing protein [Bacteroidota bacterium]|nr:PKD domain-containing protein [Bacteroidota bacterium]